MATLTTTRHTDWAPPRTDVHRHLKVAALPVDREVHLVVFDRRIDTRIRLDLTASEARELLNGITAALARLDT